MSKLLKGLFASAGLVAIEAQAALPASVTTAISDATTDGQTLGGLWLAMAVLVGVLFWLARKPS